MHAITVPHNDCVAQSMQDCWNSFTYFTVIKQLNLASQTVPPRLHWEAMLAGDRAYKGLSAFVRVQWCRWGEYREVKFVHSVQADMCVACLTPLRILPAFSPQDTQNTVYRQLACHFWQFTYLHACAWVTIAAFVLRVFAITFRIHTYRCK